MCSKGPKMDGIHNSITFPSLYTLDVLVLDNNTIHFMLVFSGKTKKTEAPNKLKLTEPYVYPFLAVHI